MGDRRQRMAAAMVESCAAKGYAGTTIADVVAAAHVSRTTFYGEFADKRACFEFAVDQCAAELRGAATGALEPDSEPAEAIRAAGAAILDLLATRPQLAQLLVGEAAAVEPALFDSHRDALVGAVCELWLLRGDVRPTHMDPVLALGRARLLVFDRITAGLPEELPQLLPEIVYLAVAPFAGHEAALAEARASDPAGGGPAR